ncbi:hypothetical protein FAGAP_130 [Fusarium agapanthi]|uniref:Uncharacterized protein n=1 Tax=Fusarium agapanthi TaxID=1803897 RepID=A0A9P5BLQ8_9HYPO|nr:hypothetical protein FAGAP_130 [Fusarium agapanthi]
MCTPFATVAQRVAQLLIQKHQISRAPTSSFEWSVDKAFWTMCPKVEEGEGLSAAFATLKSEHDPAQLMTMDREDLRKPLSFTQTKFELFYRSRTHPSPQP